MWQGRIERISDHEYRIPREYKIGMRVDGVVYTSESMMPDLLNDQACEQVANVAMLPGIAGRSMAMPDVHWGYGFPIGGVAATLLDEGGVVSPGGVGFDINCGVRLLSTNLDVADVIPKVTHLTDALFRNIPSGVGSKARIRVGAKELDSVLTDGASWAVENGYGRPEDLAHMEEEGAIDGADPDQVSQRAKTRGMPQIGSLGAGNHFLEIQKVDSIYDEAAGRRMGIERVGQVMVMVHTGSRGLGYQVCQDRVSDLESLFRKDGDSYRSDKFGFSVPDRQLVAAPIESREAEGYLGAMRAAANYAWTNRQLITHWIRESFRSVMGVPDEDMGMDLVYDVAHNIAKIEEHTVDGRRRKVCVHRKGATRSFGPGESGVPEDYSDTGQPVLIPGDMGTASYLLAGTEKAMRETFGSTCHGAGRVLSRSKAIHQFSSRSIIDDLGRRGIHVRAASPKVVAEEAPQAYKDVDEVIRVAEAAGISRKVARMVPMAVVKG